MDDKGCGGGGREIDGVREGEGERERGGGERRICLDVCFLFWHRVAARAVSGLWEGLNINVVKRESERNAQEQEVSPGARRRRSRRRRRGVTGGR